MTATPNHALQRTAPGVTPAAPPPSPATPEVPRTVVAVPDPLSARRAQLFQQIDDLTNDECDSVCLRLGLIPRDEIFDSTIKPRKELLRYARRVTSAGDLDDIARAIQDLRR